MKLDDLLSECEARHIGMAARGERLHVEAPQGAMTPDLRAALAEHKPALLAFLRRLARQVDPDAQPLRIPLTVDKPPSEYLAERGLRIVSADHNGTLFVADQEVAA